MESEILSENPWITSQIKRIEQSTPGTPSEIVLPVDVDHMDFIAKLGLPQRDFEIGGIYNPKTRSMVFSRGTGLAERGSVDPHVLVIRPRRNSDLSTDDIFFHTHPWNKLAMIQHDRDPQNTCEPSEKDLVAVMNQRMIEEEAGQNTKVISIVSSGGYLSITEAIGIQLEENILDALGVMPSQLNALKIELALSPHEYLVNSAKSPESAALMMREVIDFYEYKRRDTHVPFSKKIQELHQRIKKYCLDMSVRGFTQNQSDRVIHDIETHTPNFLNNGKLKQMGFTIEQTPAIRKMLGVTIEKKKQI